SDFVLHVNVGNSMIPDFPSVLSICNASNLPVLNPVSPNGIAGSWNPAVINPNIDSYIFTPNPGQCAQIHTLNINWETLLVTIKKGCVGQNYMLEAMGSSSHHYEWKDEQGRIVSTSAILNVTDLLSDVTQTIFPITYELTATQNGCSVSQHETVDEIFCSIPRGISPNNDNKNDTFDLTGLGVKELTVFNRYGTKVYHAINYKNEWNGSSKNGDLLPDGVYYYVIDTVSSEHLTGWVYINK
ncbi:gliding motility-associated C-terminal domain-containing protein, partial [Flavobacterium noncentrifugens]